MKFKKMILTALILTTLSACGKKTYQDGVYEGEYKNDDDVGGKSTVKLEIKDGKIISVDFKSYDKKGDLKDENYGKNSGEEGYRRAQRSVAGMKKYPGMLIEKQDINNIDTVSGATVSKKEFQEAVKDTLKKGIK